MSKDFKRGQTVKTTKLLTIDDPVVDPIFLKRRRNTTDSVIDSPIHLRHNKLWLVKHSNSGLVRGISVGFYAVYHESELEAVDSPQTPEVETNY